MSIRISELADAGTLAGNELLELSRPSPTVMMTASTISAAVGSDAHFLDSASGFVTAGFAVGDSVRVQGFTDGGNNVFSARITALDAGTMTIGGDDGASITDEAAGDAVTITRWESRRTSAQNLIEDIGGDGSTQGKHSIAVLAGSIIPSFVGGCEALAQAVTAGNRPDLLYLNFDPMTQEHAQFAIPMPKKWNEGTITARFHWSHGSTVTNFGVAWQLEAVAVGDDDSIDVAFGTGQVVTDTGGTANDLYITAETAAITVGGLPAAQDMVFFRVARAPSNGADTMGIDARLHAVEVFITTDADTDA